MVILSFFCRLGLPCRDRYDLANQSAIAFKGASKVQQSAYIPHQCTMVRYRSQGRFACFSLVTLMLRHRIITHIQHNVIHCTRRYDLPHSHQSTTIGQR